MGKIMDKIRSWTEKQKIKHEIKKDFALDIANKIVNGKELKETVEGAKNTVEDVNGL